MKEMKLVHRRDMILRDMIASHREVFCKGTTSNHTSEHNQGSNANIDADSSLIVWNADTNAHLPNAVKFNQQTWQSTNGICSVTNKNSNYWAEVFWRSGAEQVASRLTLDWLQTGASAESRSACDAQRYNPLHLSLPKCTRKCTSYCNVLDLNSRPAGEGQNLPPPGFPE